MYQRYGLTVVRTLLVIKNRMEISYIIQTGFGVIIALIGFIVSGIKTDIVKLQTQQDDLEKGISRIRERFVTRDDMDKKHDAMLAEMKELRASIKELIRGQK